MRISMNAASKAAGSGVGAFHPGYHGEPRFGNELLYLFLSCRTVYCTWLLGRLSVSIGLGVIEASEQRKPRGALQLADEALYQAKVKGRNRVEIKNSAEYNALVTGVFMRGSIANGG